MRGKTRQQTLSRFPRVPYLEFPWFPFFMHQPLKHGLPSYSYPSHVNHLRHFPFPLFTTTTTRYHQGCISREPRRNERKRETKRNFSCLHSYLSIYPYHSFVFVSVFVCSVFSLPVCCASIGEVGVVEEVEARWVQNETQISSIHERNERTRRRAHARTTNAVIYIRYVILCYYYIIIIVLIFTFMFTSIFTCKLSSCLLHLYVHLISFTFISFTFISFTSIFTSSLSSPPSSSCSPYLHVHVHFTLTSSPSSPLPLSIYTYRA
ncbi:hypothetical protein BU24DRAFT_236496 [Aaosphaeria arxii CBS 175.79]|uniref:Uncharacterized protein n=1 Tax=Aaosphaeria arxii CBS 175.79 TaxID=1450172 RepID=A0A6A5XJD6_9PLEO|nr:uncharacterized protein BU24DRAFT_236496 [Aaosphaeria arxii CBS 175.79]KAF2013378.1 hypothetical protein BU24DRAFT_236496 [Aaosphaeria arxii CBS 175.79]